MTKLLTIFSSVQMQHWKVKSMKHTGGCHCGQITLESNLEPMAIVQCNCQSCRRLTGAISVTTLYGEDEIQITGNTDCYTHQGGSGGDVTTHFCVRCNTRVKYFFDIFEGIVLVPIGCFDEVKSFEPKLEIWTDEKLTWLSDNGCFVERVKDMGVQERLMVLLASLEDRWNIFISALIARTYNVPTV